MSDAAPLAARGLRAGYAPGVAIVDGVSFALRPGTMTALVGPNGAGKSTLLKAVLGLAPWREGDASFFGGSFDDARARVAVIPQRSDIDWNFPATALEVASMGLYARLGLFRRVTREARSVAQAALADVGLAEQARTRIGELSGGQQQRVLVARALTQRAELLLLDEPFANTDATSESRIVGALRRACAAGATVLAVVHDLAGARRHFDDAIVLNRRIVAHGPVAQALSAEPLELAYGLRVVAERSGA